MRRWPRCTLLHGTARFPCPFLAPRRMRAPPPSLRCTGAVGARARARRLRRLPPRCPQACSCRLESRAPSVPHPSSPPPPPPPHPPRTDPSGRSTLVQSARRPDLDCVSSPPPSASYQPPSTSSLRWPRLAPVPAPSSHFALAGLRFRHRPQRAVRLSPSPRLSS